MKPKRQKRRGIRRPAGISTIELLVGLAIFTMVASALYLVISHYSRSFLRLDDRVANVTEGWRVVQALQEDILAADLPAGDRQRWAEAIQGGADGCTLIRRSGGGLTTVSYVFDRTDHSLIRIADGQPRTLIQSRCREFLIQPEFAGATIGSPPHTIRVHLRLELEQPVTGPSRGFEPVVAETSLTPEFLNRRLNQEYLHEGMP